MSLLTRRSSTAGGARVPAATGSSAAALVWRAGDGRAGAPDPLRKTVDPRGGATGQRVLPRPVPGRGRELRGPARPRAHRPGPPRDAPRARGRVPRRRAAAALLLADDGARRRHRRASTPSPCATCRRPPPTTPSAPAAPGAPASPRWSSPTAPPATPRPVLLPALRANGRRARRPAAPRPRQRGPVRSHVHAIWLAETGVSLGSRMTDVLDMPADEAGEQPGAGSATGDVPAQLADPAAARRRGRARARGARRAPGDLDKPASGGREHWVERHAPAAAAAFDAPSTAGATLFRAALAEQREQNRRRPRQLRPQPEREQAASAAAWRPRTSCAAAQRGRRRAVQRLLPLPLPRLRRLPARLLLPAAAARRLHARRGSGARRRLLQRPRFLAISEFGPGALIYHEGPATRSPASSCRAGRGRGRRGHHRGARAARAAATTTIGRSGNDRCEACGDRLGGRCPACCAAHRLHPPPQRITSDEEERRRAASSSRPPTASAPRRPPGRLDASSDVVRDEATAARRAGLRRRGHRPVSTSGRRRRKDPKDDGFWLDPVAGPLAQRDQAADTRRRTRGGEPTTTPSGRQGGHPVRGGPPQHPRPPAGRAGPESTRVTLRYALERGIEAAFQLEDSELTSEQLPDADGRGPDAVHRVRRGRRRRAAPPAGRAGALASARKALEIAHFDPETGDDLGQAHGATGSAASGLLRLPAQLRQPALPRAIDRHRVRDLLLHAGGGTRTAADRRRVSPSEHAIGLLGQGDQPRTLEASSLPG